MSRLIVLDQIRHQRALTNWLEDCKRRMSLKFPEIKFESDDWPIRRLYKTDQADWYFTQPFACFESKDRSYCDVVRGLVAEMVIQGKPQHFNVPIKAFCLLAQVDAQSIFEITLNDLRKAEDTCLIKARARHSMAGNMVAVLSKLKTQIDLLAQKGVIPWLGFHPRHEIKVALSKLRREHDKLSKTDRSSILDNKIEAFNDALNALYENDSRLSAADRVAIAVTTRLMCAPSRINEVLCSAIDDHVTVEDYAKITSLSTRDLTHRAHQMLLITMKGSKGSSWGAKPALNFMIDAFNYATDVIKQHGQRSRKLIEWYQQHPDTLYLPSELEYLRGKDLNRLDLAKIVCLTESPSNAAIMNTFKHYFNHLKDKQFKAQNPNVKTKNGHRNTWKTIKVIPFMDVEHFLLQKVHLAMEACRKVTQNNHYKGDLSKMLTLFDREATLFLPSVLNYRVIGGRLNQAYDILEPTLFKKLGITMPVNGKVEDAWIETHDPRRWLTTQALRHGEKLSDVLINKWANRLKLAQLKAYDLRSDQELASFSRMPVIAELADISGGIEKANKLEEGYGLKSLIVSVPDANISVTSMDLVLRAVEDRPIARTSEQIIILYPSKYGICLHQHHETPCRNYDSCMPCDSNVTIKGHMPSNDSVRSRSELIHKSIIRQMDRLIIGLNRGIADNPGSLAQHILTLVEKGLDRELMVDHLITEFHQIKDMVEDKLLIKRLEEAFVARGFVMLLDDREIPGGALIKYHNPTYNASPGLEKALDSHGGRAEILYAEESLIQKYPQFAPQTLYLKDKRHLLEADGENSED